MAKYLFTNHGGGGMAETEEEMAAIMDEWTAWYGAMGEAVVDGGAPVAMSKTVSAAGVTDGGGANPSTGYTVIEATSIDAAAAHAGGCPELARAGSVEVSELIELPGM